MNEERSGREAITTAMVLPLPEPQARRATSPPSPQLQRQNVSTAHPTVGHRDRASGHQYRWHDRTGPMV